MYTSYVPRTEPEAMVLRESLAICHCPGVGWKINIALLWKRERLGGRPRLVYREWL